MQRVKCMSIQVSLIRMVSSLRKVFLTYHSTTTIVYRMGSRATAHAPQGSTCPPYGTLIPLLLSRVLCSVMQSTLYRLHTVLCTFKIKRNADACGVLALMPCGERLQVSSINRTLSGWTCGSRLYISMIKV